MNAQRPTVLYDTFHPNCDEIIGAIADGTNIRRREVTHWAPEPCLVYGVLRGCQGAMRKNIAAGIAFWHVDHGYYGGRGKYYRISPNNTFCPLSVMTKRADYWQGKWSVPPVSPLPYKAGAGSTILIAPPTEAFCRYSPIFSVDRKEWLQAVIDTVRAQTTKLRIEIREKGRPGEPIDWSDIHCVISHSSNILVEATIAGVPAIATAADHPITSLGFRLLRINEIGKGNEESLSESRDRLLAAMGRWQFTLEEMSQGLVPF